MWPKRDARMLVEGNPRGLKPPPLAESSTVNPSSALDTGLSSSRVSKGALRFDPPLRKILVALYATGILVVLLTANTPLVQLPSADRTALNWLVLAAGLLLVGARRFPWSRFDRNLLLVPVLVGVSLLALTVYFSGGWSSPLYIFYLFAVLFCAIYFDSGLAALCIGFILLASLSPQLYTPDTTGLVEHLTSRTPAYLALAFVSRYMRRCILREYEINLQKMREIEDHFRRETSVDRLTNIFNRTHFETRLREECKRVQRLNGNFILIFLDLDDFKQINDTYGHRVGDEALKLVAHVLQSNARQMDVVARYGGDEFATLMPGTSLSGVRNFFDRIRTEVAEHSRLALGFTIHLSAGIAKFPYDTGDAQDLLEAADEAMYQAKRQGKGRIFAAISS